VVGHAEDQARTPIEETPTLTLTVRPDRLKKAVEEWWRHRNNPDAILVWPEALLVWVVVGGLLLYCFVKQ
jgi:hypothetical protein